MLLAALLNAYVRHLKTDEASSSPFQFPKLPPGPASVASVVHRGETHDSPVADCSSEGCSIESQG